MNKTFEDLKAEVNKKYGSVGSVVIEYIEKCEEIVRNAIDELELKDYKNIAFKRLKQKLRLRK